MEVATIQGETRQPGNRHANEGLRRRGLIPAVIYGHGQNPEHVSLSRHDTELALSRATHVVQVRIEGRDQQYLLKDVQFDHLQKTPVHVDLMRVDVHERVQVKVPLEFRGTAKGVAEGGGVLLHVMSELEIECAVLAIPESIRVRVDFLELNQSLHVREIELPEGVEALAKPEDIVAVVQPPRAVVEPTAAVVPAEGEAAAKEPEVISKGKVETEEEAGA